MKEFENMSFSMWFHLCMHKERLGLPSLTNGWELPQVARIQHTTSEDGGDDQRRTDGTFLYRVRALSHCVSEGTQDRMGLPVSICVHNCLFSSATKYMEPFCCKKIMRLVCCIIPLSIPVHNSILLLISFNFIKND